MYKKFTDLIGRSDTACFLMVVGIFYLIYRIAMW